MLPFCQDTGTATVIAKKGQQVWTGANDAEYLSKGIYQTYTEENLRYSQTIPLDMYQEINSGTNLPAQIDLYATEGASYEFLFVAKGGGSANKTFLFQETKALLNPKSLEAFIVDKMRHLGTAACPPVSPRHRHRRHLRRGLPEDGQARVGQIPRRAAGHGQRARPGFPRRRA